MRHRPLTSAWSLRSRLLVGILAYGPLDRLFDTRKWVIVPGAVCTIGLLAALALVPGLPAAAAVVLLILFTGVTSYSVVIVAHGRSLFPDHLLGRGMTFANFLTIGGAGLVQFLSGLYVSGMKDAGMPVEAVWAALHVSFAAITIAALAVYLLAPMPKQG